jgi:HD superfamily phosphohydrolase
MNLRSDKDVETYLLKSRSDDNEKKNCYRQFNVALESTSINFIFFRTYYSFNQFIKNRQENFCNRKCYKPTAKDDNSNYER